jgi:hypothetical protein
MSRIAQDCHQEPTLLGGDCLRVWFPEGLEIFLQHCTQSDKRVNWAGCEGGLPFFWIKNTTYSPDPARSLAALRDDSLCSAQHAVANILFVTDRNIPIATARSSGAPLLLHIASCRWNEAQLLPDFLTAADEWQWRTTTTNSSTTSLTGLSALSPLNRTRCCG